MRLFWVSSPIWKQFRSKNDTLISEVAKNINIVASYFEVDKCIKAHKIPYEKCIEEWDQKVAKNEDDFNKHKDDPVNMSEETKKDVCWAMEVRRLYL